MLKVALCCILFVWFWTLLHGIQLPKVENCKRELSDQQMRCEEELAQQHKRLMNMKHGLGREKRQEDAQSCSAIKRRHDSAESGEYILTKDGRNVTTFCDMNTTGEGWTVFQRRISDSVSFDRNWTDYKNGFGNMTGNFWWGNDNLAAFTSTGRYILKIEFQFYNDASRYYVQYTNFRIEDEEDKYRLRMGEYSGNMWGWGWHNGQMFSTPDQDNDVYDNFNCAQKHHSGWWYHDCFDVNLNAPYNGKSFYGIGWEDDTYKNCKWSEMKFRSI